jgi:hypothetical protein
LGRIATLIILAVLVEVGALPADLPVERRRGDLMRKIRFALKVAPLTCLSGSRENMLQDTIAKLEPVTFLPVTGLKFQDFNSLLQLRVLNT